MDTLVVDLNRAGPHSIDVAAASFHTDGPFEVVLDNHGAALHVYVQLDDDLARALTLSAGNHFVEKGKLRRVGVDVDESALPVRGRMKVVTGYGAETEYLTVSVEPRDEEKGRVDVDESLAAPRPRPVPRSRRPDVDLLGLPALLLGGLAIVVALLAAITLESDLAVLVVLFVLVGAGVAAVLIRG